MSTTRLGLFAFLLALLSASNAAHAAYPLECKARGGDGRTYYIADATLANKCKYSWEDQDNCTLSSSAGCKWTGSYTGTASATQVSTATKTATATLTNTKTATSTGLGGVTGSSSRTQTQTATKTATQTQTATKTQTLTRTATATQTDPRPATQTRTATQTATQTASQTRTLTSTEATEETDPTETGGSTLADAIKESEVASGQAEELKATMEELRVNNENNAILYRSPDANLMSVDPKFAAFGSMISGDDPRISQESELASHSTDGAKDQMHKDTEKRREKNRDKFGRRLASASGGISSAEAAGKADATTEAAAPTGEQNSATSDNPWVTYMGQTSKAGLIDRLRKNPSLRDSLRDRLAELQAAKDESGLVELIEEALAVAEKEGQSPTLDDLKPMNVAEAFSMNADETEAQIRSLLADLDSTADAQLLPQATLFERVSVAHRRSLVRGSLKATR